MTPVPGEVHWKMLEPKEFKTETKSVPGMEEPSLVVPIPKVFSYVH